MTGNTITMGNVTIISLSDGHLAFAPTQFFPSVAEEEWEPFKDYLTQDGKIVVNIGSFLLRTPTRTILVDSGMGEHATPPPNSVSGLLLQDMAANGIRREEVGMVVITHLHIDHVGWNLIEENGELRPTFPNARYWIPRRDWDYYIQQPQESRPTHFNDQVVPLEALNVLRFMEGEQVLTEELTCLPTPGHTPGHTSVLVSSQGERAVILGDVAHSPAQVHQTGWCPRVDVDADQSIASRTSVMERIEQEGSLALAGHFPAPSFGRLVRREGVRVWQAL